MRIGFAIPYRGGTKDWSTRFHLSAEPPDTSHWHNLFEAMWADLKAGIRGDVQLMYATGYTNDTTPYVWREEFDGTFGTLTPAAPEQAAIICALLHFTTDVRNSRGGPVFLRNFIHGVNASSSDYDAPSSTQKAALNTFASTLAGDGAGYSDGTTTYHRAGPDGDSGIVGTCNDFLSRRVLARRG